MITQDELKKLISYNHKTGEMLWLERSPSSGISEAFAISINKRIAGKPVGTLQNLGNSERMVATILYKRCTVHQLAWLYHYGYWPKVIDHINGDPKDNRISNLRDTTPLGNTRNRGISINNTSGYNGVMRRGERWLAYIYVNRKQVRLGSFAEKEEAIKARALANIKYGFHENHGKRGSYNCKASAAQEKAE